MKQKNIARSIFKVMCCLDNVIKPGRSIMKDRKEMIKFSDLKYKHDDEKFKSIITGSIEKIDKVKDSKFEIIFVKNKLKKVDIKELNSNSLKQSSSRKTRLEELFELREILINYVKNKITWFD